MGKEQETDAVPFKESCYIRIFSCNTAGTALLAKIAGVICPGKGLVKSGIHLYITDSLRDGSYKLVRVHLVPRVSLQQDVCLSVCLLPFPRNSLAQSSAN